MLLKGWNEEHTVLKHVLSAVCSILCNPNVVVSRAHLGDVGKQDWNQPEVEAPLLDELVLDLRR